MIRGFGTIRQKHVAPRYTVTPFPTRCRYRFTAVPYHFSLYTEVYSVLYGSGSVPRRAVFSPRETSPVNKSHAPFSRVVSRFTCPGSLLRRNMKRLRGGLVFKAHSFYYHSTLGLRVKDKKKRFTCPRFQKGDECLCRADIRVPAERARLCRIHGTYLPVQVKSA